MPPGPAFPLARPVEERSRSWRLASGQNWLAVRPWLGAGWSRGAAIVAATVLQFWLASTLGPERYGEYLFAWVNALVVTAIAMRGHETLTMRWAARYRALDQSASLRRFLDFSGRRALRGAVLGAAALATVGLLLSSFSRDASPQLLLIAAPVVPLLAALRVSEAALRGMGGATSGSLSTWGGPSAMLAILATTNGLLPGRLTPTVVFAVQLGVTACFAIGSTALVASRTVRPLPAARATRESDTRDLREWYREARPLALISIASIVQTQGVLMLLGWTRGPEATSLLGVAIKVAALLHAGVEAVNLVSAPRFGASHATNDDAALQSHATRAVVLSFSIAAVGALGVLSLREWGLRQLGPGYEGAGPALSLLVATMLFCAGCGSANTLLDMAGRSWLCLWAIVAAAAIGLLAALALIPVWGVTGAAIGHAVGLLVRHVSLAWTARRDLGVTTGIHAALIQGPAPRPADAQRQSSRAA